MYIVSVLVSYLQYEGDSNRKEASPVSNCFNIHSSDVLLLLFVAFFSDNVNSIFSNHLIILSSVS